MKNSIVIKDLSDIVGNIVKAKREEVRPQIERLQKFVGSTEDLFVDRRTKTWAENGPARTTVEARNNQKKYLVTWRNGDRPIECTPIEAAQITRKTVKSLSMGIYKTGKLTVVDPIDNDVITVEKL